MFTVANFLSEIESFCREAGIAEATFGSRAARDGKFVKRLRDGAGVTLRTVDSVRSYIAAERAKAAKQVADAAPASQPPLVNAAAAETAARLPAAGEAK